MNKNLLLEVYLRKLIISTSHVVVQCTDIVKDSRALKRWTNNEIILLPFYFYSRDFVAFSWNSHILKLVSLSQ